MTANIFSAVETGLEVDWLHCPVTSKSSSLHLVITQITPLKNHLNTGHVAIVIRLVGLLRNSRMLPLPSKRFFGLRSVRSQITCVLYFLLLFRVGRLLGLFSV